MLRREPVPAQELADAKDSLVLGLPADFATAGGIAGRVAELALHGLPDDYWNRYSEAVRKVDAEAVLRAAERYLDPAKMTVVMVANPAVVRQQLAGLPLGTVEERPVAPPAEAPGKAPARAVIGR